MINLYNCRNLPIKANLKRPYPKIQRGSSTTIKMIKNIKVIYLHYYDYLIHYQKADTRFEIFEDQIESLAVCLSNSCFDHS